MVFILFKKFHRIIKQNVYSTFSLENKIKALHFNHAPGCTDKNKQCL